MLMQKRISWVLLFVFALVPLVGFFYTNIVVIAREYFLTLCYLLLVACLWRNAIGRIFSVILLVFWVLNIAASLIMWSMFNSPMNTELAMIVLSTNFEETLGFMMQYWLYVLLGFALFFTTLWLTNRLAKDIPSKILKIATIILIGTVVYKFSESAFRGRLSDPRFSILEKILPYSSLNNMGTFSRAQKELSLLNLVKSYQPEYKLIVEDTGIDTYVIILGESVRRNNVALYGYHRDTSPNTIAHKDNLYIFEQAIAAAPTTTMALSSALTIKPADSNDMQLLADNIITLANAAGFETYWYSRQGVIGQNETPITLIANNAKHKEWLNTGYDDVLIERLENVLNTDSIGKKLIVLHTNGSHLSACNQYPQQEHYLSDGESYYSDCYDNSIRYMDKLLGRTFALLEKQKAAVFYFSDHGQLRRVKHNGDINYIHGAVNPVKEAVDVPQFIWFSPALPISSKHIGKLNAPFLQQDNYYLIEDWLGIQQVGQENIRSPWSRSYQSRTEIKVTDTYRTVFNYWLLPSENEQ